MKRTNRSLFIIITSAALLILFQNCSKVGVSELARTATEKSTNLTGSGMPDNGTPTAVTDSTATDSTEIAGMPLPGSPNPPPIAGMPSPGSPNPPPIAGMPSGPASTTTSSTPGAAPILDLQPSLVTASSDCTSFMNSLGTIDQTATKDEHVAGRSEDTSLGAIRNLKVTGNSGSVKVRSAIQTHQISGNSGDIFVNTGSADHITGDSGELCLKAQSIGHITGNSSHVTIAAQTIQSLSANSSHGYVTAQKIGSLHSGSGVLHIFKAQIGMMKGQSGTICLHDGAAIAGRDSSSSAEVRTDCPETL